MLDNNASTITHSTEGPATGGTSVTIPGPTIDSVKTEITVAADKAVDTAVADLAKFAQDHAPSIKEAIGLMTDEIATKLKAAVSDLEALAAKHGFTF